MKKCLFFAVIVSFVTSCVSSQFTLTGTSYPPLAENSQIKVILTKNTAGLEYEEIGLISVKHDDFSSMNAAIEKAKKIARANGGNMIMLISSGSQTAVSGNEFGVYSGNVDYYMFVVCRMSE